jgi:hypothetical protein
VGAVVSIVRSEATVEVWLTDSVLKYVTEVARTAYSPGDKVSVVQFQIPELASASQVDPVFVHVPLDGLVPRGAVDNCTIEPTGADPENIKVDFVVMLSVETPVSSSALRVGADVVGSEYRTTTIPKPPAPPSADAKGPLQ